MRPEQPIQKKSTAHILLVCLLLFGIPAGVCIYKGDLVTGVALAAVGLSCYLGYRAGAIRALATVGGIVAAIYFAPQWAPSVESFLAEKLSLSGLMNRGASLGIVGLAVVVAVILIGRVLCRLLLSKDGLGPLNGLNRWGGLLLMGGEAVIAIALLLGGILIVSPEQEDLPSPPDSATLGERFNYQIDVVAAETRSGAIGRVLKKHNPFLKFPQLNKFKEIQQTVHVISDPTAMKQVITHPRIKELRGTPAVELAIINLEADEEIQQIISSGEPLDGEKIMTLLKSQVIMDLLDEPQFIEEASRIIETVSPANSRSTSFKGSSFVSPAGALGVMLVLAVLPAVVLHSTAVFSRCCRS